MTVKNLVRIVWAIFGKIEKVQKWPFFGHFWTFFGCFSNPNHTILMPLHTWDPNMV